MLFEAAVMMVITSLMNLLGGLAFSIWTGEAIGSGSFVVPIFWLVLIAPLLAGFAWEEVRERIKKAS